MLWPQDWLDRWSRTRTAKRIYARRIKARRTLVKQQGFREFGGLGGIRGGRRLNRGDKFEMAIRRALGKQMRGDDSLCREIWSALANVDWLHENGDRAGYSFRAAGDLIAAIIGRGEYMDWYCCGPIGVVSDRVAEAMAKLGWTAKSTEMDLSEGETP